MKKQEDVREAIMAAAKARLVRYGYGKTTMAELAGDCKMSAGNLYRYFVSKLDIAEALARESFAKTTATLREVVRKPGTAAADKLEAFVVQQLLSTYQELEHDPHSTEIGQLISRERPEVTEEWLRQVESLVAEILAQGNASGEFDVADVAGTAALIEAALLRYRYPQLWGQVNIAELEREARALVRLMVRGLRRG
jgi:AcrR family transcriptional regulator